MLLNSSEEISESEFLKIVIFALADLSDKFTDFEQNISGFVKNVSSNKLPHYLQPGNNFLGKF